MLKDLLKKPLSFIKEYNGFYYVRVKSSGDFDELIWKVKKSTGVGVPMHMMEYFEIDDKAKEVNPRTLKGMI